MTSLSGVGLYTERKLSQYEKQTDSAGGTVLPEKRAHSRKNYPVVTCDHVYTASISVI